MNAYDVFRAMHAAPGAFVMPNPWDAASALVLKRAGFVALGTSSAAMAFSLGRRDGAHAIAREEAVAHAAFLQSVSGLPVNGDFEDGFGADPSDCVRTVEAAVAAGLAGLGIEDTTADPAQPIHAFDTAVARMRAAAAAARGRIVLTDEPTTTSSATTISMTRSAASRRSPTSAATCSTRRACRIWMRFAPLCARLRQSR
jgi:2-methylisocitrate lyase-like PEP mutase family enzyme